MGFVLLSENCAFRNLQSGLFGLSMLSIFVMFAVDPGTMGRVRSDGVLWKH